MACAKAGCNQIPSKIAASRVNAGAVAVDASNVYWAESSGIYSCPVAGCKGATPTQLSTESAAGIAVDATHLYYTTGFAALDGGAVKVCAKAGCANAPTTMAILPGTTWPYGIAVDSSAVYWANYKAGSIMSCALGGCANTPATLASGLSTTIGVAIDKANVYFTTTVAAGQVLSAPLGGGSVTSIASGQTYPLAVAVDAKGVYWTRSDQGGSIAECPGGACGSNAPTALASQLNGPDAIVTDATAIYWIDSGAQNVMRLAR